MCKNKLGYLAKTEIKPNFSRNSRTFPHSITNKEGGDGKSSKFETNDKRVRNHPFREMKPDKRFKTNYKSITP